MPRISNPYGVQTPIGAGLSNLARLALARRDQADKQELYDRQAGLYDAQRAKAEAETAGIVNTNDLRSPAGMNRTVALRYGVPVENIEALGGYADGVTPMPPALPGGVSHTDVGRTLANLRTGYGSKSSSAGDIALGEARLREADARGDVFGGRASPTTLRQAYGTGPVFSQNAQGSVLNTVEGGVDQSNPLAVASIASERAQANQRNAAAGSSAAAARKYRLEGDNLQAGRFGPIVNVQVDDMNGPVTVPRFAGQISEGVHRVAPKAPTGGLRLKAVVGADGGVEYVPEADAVGRTPAALPKAPTPPKPVDERRIRTELNRQLGILMDSKGVLAPDSAKPLNERDAAMAVARAAEIARETGNVAEAVSQVVYEMGDLKDETQPGRLWGENETGRRIPSVPLAPARPRAITPAAPAAPAAAAPAAASAVPPPAQRQRGAVYQTPRGPMQWTGTGWVPAGGT